MKVLNCTLNAAWLIIRGKCIDEIEVRNCKTFAVCGKIDVYSFDVRYFVIRRCYLLQNFIICARAMEFSRHWNPRERIRFPERNLVSALTLVCAIYTRIRVLNESNVYNSWKLSPPSPFAPMFAFRAADFARLWIPAEFAGSIIKFCPPAIWQPAWRLNSLAPSTFAGTVARRAQFHGGTSRRRRVKRNVTQLNFPFSYELS